MATYNPLLLKRQKLAEEQAEIDRRIALEQAEARAAALLQIKALMSTFAISTGEIAPPPPRKTAKASRPTKAARKSMRKARGAARA